MSCDANGMQKKHQHGLEALQNKTGFLEPLHLCVRSSCGFASQPLAQPRRQRRTTNALNHPKTTKFRPAINNGVAKTPSFKNLITLRTAAVHFMVEKPTCYFELINDMNSCRVARLVLNSPSKALVIVFEPGFRMPRIDMQECSALITTAAPLHCKCSDTSLATV